MSPLLLLVGLILLPIVVAMLLKVNAAVLFMSLCVGQILVQYISQDTVTIVTSTSSSVSNTSVSAIKLVLLLLPAAATAVFMLHSVHGKKWIINILPAIAFGFLTALFVEPLLSAHYQHILQNSNLWHQVLQAQTSVVAAGSFVALLFLWFQARSGESHHKHLGGASHHKN
jgi:hypothetical protein